jgi:GNAT superfamily N-acetyltransferase
LDGAQTTIQIRQATEQDVPVILQLIRSLADYERLSHEVTATEDDLRASLFGEHPAAEVLLAHAGGEPIGFAVFFQSYSTFLGRPGLYLEDLFVLPAWRGQGHGRQLLARVAQLAVERGCGRMEWSVLDWNQPAIDFYKRLGAQPMEQWTVHRLSGAALARLAGNSPTTS